MEYEHAAILLRSEDTAKQLEALNSVIAVLQSLPPNEEFLMALIERGLSCEKSHLVRQLSFQCIDLLYGVRVTRWGDVRAAISAELGTAESPECLFAAIRVLYNLPMMELVCTIGSKDMMSVIKGCLQADNVHICAVSVENLGPLLIDTWLYVQGANSIDGIVSVESTSEARRFRDDICDFIGEVFKNIALGIIGKAPSQEVNQTLPDHSRTVGAYFSVVADLLERYFACYDELHCWTASLLGASLPVPPPRGESDASSRSASLSLLMRQVLPTILVDPYLLFHRWNQMPFHTGIMSCISHALLVTLLSIPADQGSLGYFSRLVFEDKAGLQFNAVVEKDETAASRAKQMEINIVRVSEEWLLNHLMPALKSVIPSEVSMAVYTSLCFLQIPYLVHKRLQTYPLILENIHRILLQGSLSMPHCSTIDENGDLFADYYALVPWALFTCRFVSRKTMGDYLPTIIEEICVQIKDDVSRSKLLAEVAALLLIDVEETGGVAHPEVLYSVLGNSFVVSCLQADPPSVPSIQHHFLRERLLLALCRLSVKLLPVVIAYVLSAVQQSGAGGGSMLLASTGPAIVHDAFGSAPDMLIASGSNGNGGVSSPENPVSKPLPLPHSGVGRYTVFGGEEEEAGDAESVILAMGRLENLIASTLFILRSCHKCLVWPTDGNAGFALQLAYVELISSLSDIITPTHRLVNGQPDMRAPPFIQQALEWAKGPFVDIVAADLALLEAQDKSSAAPFPTQNLRMKVLQVVSQYAGVMFVDAPIKVKIIAGLLRSVLLRTRERDRYTSVLSSRTAKGYLGGAVAAHPSHPFLSSPVQHQALCLLELLAKSNPTTAAEQVLYILYECEALCIAEGKRNHHIMCPSLDERLALAVRRVKQCCPDGTGASVSRPKDFQMDAPTPQALKESDLNAKKAKVIADRKKSVAFSTYDNSMADVFTAEKLRRSSELNDMDDPMQISASGYDIFDSVWRVSVQTDAFSVPLDVDKQYSAFSPQALFGKVGAIDAEEPGRRRHVCSADIMGIVDDVLDAHLSVPSSLSSFPKNAPRDLFGGAAQLGRTYDVRDCRQWVQLNGSSDLFTVLGAVSCCDPVTGNVEVMFRVINSAGFKVPIFSLQLLLGSYEQMGFHGEDEAVTFDTVNQTARGGTAEGVEYFLPGAMVERTFNFRIQKFTAAYVVLRVVYPELMAEIDCVEAFAVPTAITASSQTAENSGDGGGESGETRGKKRFKEVEIPRVGSFDCMPLALPTTLLLIPYGAGALSSMMQHVNRGVRGDYCNRGDFHGGISKQVYQNLHARTRYSRRLPILSYPRHTTDGICEVNSFADEVTLAVHRIGQSHSAGNAAPCTPSWWWEKGSNWALGMASRVRLGQASASSTRQLTSVLCWCLQDWWGEEICITLQASKICRKGTSQLERDVFWSGWMDIQCNSKSALSILADDANNLLHSLTGGLMRLHSSIDDVESVAYNTGTLPVPDSVDMTPGEEADNRLGSCVPVSILQGRTEAVLKVAKSYNVKVKNFMLSKVLCDNPPVAVTSSGVASFL